MPASSPLTIRELTVTDSALMYELLTMFGAAFEEVEIYGGARPGQPYLERLLGSNYFIALAAIEDGAVVGGISAYELHKFEQERSEIYLYDLAVAESHRRQGVATELIEKLKKVARQRGAYVIFVQADVGDGPAVSLYSKLGVREDVLNFDIAIADR